MEGVEKDNMAVWYKHITEEKNLWKQDSALLEKMEANIEAKLKEFDEKIKVAEREEGETDVRDLMIQKGEYLAKSGDRKRAVKLFKEIRRGPHVTSNCKLDMAFVQLRMALFYNDEYVDEEDMLAEKLAIQKKEAEEKAKKEEEEKKRQEAEDKRKKEEAEKAEKVKNGEKIAENKDDSKASIKKATEAAAAKKKADKKKKQEDTDSSKKNKIINFHSYAENIDYTKELVEATGDWDRRNRLKVYEAVHLSQCREFEKAANLFLDAVPTFTSLELMSYEKLVEYTVITCILSVSRKNLKKDLIDGSDIQEQLFNLPKIRDYLNNFYNCEYDKFFLNLAEMEGLLKADRYFAKHFQFYIREMRLQGYKQILASYSSLSIEYMGKAFGVTTEFIDTELSRFIASGRIPAKIDHVAGIVVTNRPDIKNQQYREVVKKGDSLLNRVQKLSRVINI